MTMTDPIADMLTRVRNANVAMHDTVRMPSSRVKEALAVILEREGYIAGFSTIAREGHPGEVLEISLKYTADRARDRRAQACLQAWPADLLPRRRVATCSRRTRGGSALYEQGSHDRPRGTPAACRW